MTSFSRDEIAVQWARVGGGLTIEPAKQPISLEKLIAGSAEVATQEQRIMSVAATWLGIHHAFINSRKLAIELGALEGKDSAVAGAMMDMANQLAHSERIAVWSGNCRPLLVPEPLFPRGSGIPRIREWTEQSALPLFRKWGLWYHEVSFKVSAIRPVGWILKRCPELRARALLGPGLEAEIGEILLAGDKPIIAVARVAGSSYGATHEAIERMVDRGLVERSTTHGKSFTLSSLLRDSLAPSQGMETAAKHSMPVRQDLRTMTR